MAQTRRSFLFSLLLSSLPGWVWGKPPGEAADDRLALAVARETGGHVPVESGQVSLEVPDIAEDGAIVPVTVESGLPDVDAVWVFVEKNPVPLAARFTLDKSLDPFVSLRVKMNESCELVVIVKSGEAYFSARKPVRVVIGGCG